MYATSVIKTIDTDLDYNDGYTMSQLFPNTWFNGMLIVHLVAILICPIMFVA